MTCEIENEYLRNLIEKLLGEYRQLLSRYANDAGACNAYTMLTNEAADILKKPRTGDALLRIRNATTAELLDELRVRLEDECMMESKGLGQSGDDEIIEGIKTKSNTVNINFLDDISTHLKKAIADLEKGGKCSKKNMEDYEYHFDYHQTDEGDHYCHTTITDRKSGDVVRELNILADRVEIIE